MAKKPKDMDVHFMKFAELAAENATCLRKKVGVALVDKGGVFSTGYNSAVRGQPHCDDEGVGCMMEDGHCVRVLHAEVDAIIRCAREGRQTDGATLYTLASPCWPCFKVTDGAGNKRIVFKEFYRDERIFEYAEKVGIELVHLRTCCRWHRENPGPWKESSVSRFDVLMEPEKCRCLEKDCSPCSIERAGCGCDGAFDDGCFLCTPDKHERPVCESLKEKAA